MRQHSSYSAAAWSAAGDGGRPRWTARRAHSSVPRGRRRLPRCAAPRARTPVLYWHTRRLNWPNARLPLTGAAPVAAQVAGVRARLATAERSRARPRGAPAPAGVRVLAPRVSTPLYGCRVERGRPGDLSPSPGQPPSTAARRTVADRTLECPRLTHTYTRRVCAGVRPRGHGGDLP